MSEKPDPFAGDPWLAQQPPRPRRIPKWLIYTGIGCGSAIALTVVIYFVIVAVAAIVYVSQAETIPEDVRLPEGGTTPLETQIETLSRFSIDLPEDLSIEDLCKAHPRAAYEERPFELLLTFLGDAELDREPGRENPGDVLLLDFDCIEDTGDYTLFAERMRDLADGALPLEGISDELDLERRVATLHFEIDGQPQHWEANFDGDLLDRSILSRFASMLAEGTRGTRFACAKIRDDPGLVIVCVDRDQLSELRQQTGIDFDWLE